MAYWKPIPQAPLYEANTNGEIRSMSKPWKNGPRVMKPEVNKQGYLRLQLRVDGRYKHFFVHRLVLAAHVGDSLLGVNHKDGDPLNNSLYNLEYATQSANVLHYRNVLGVGADNSGEKHPLAKLTAADVTEIRRQAAKGASQNSLAVRFGVSQPNISKILSGRRWA